MAIKYASLTHRRYDCFYADSGSEVISLCTKTSNAICQCRDGFTNSVKDSTICKCAMGSGLDKSGKVESHNTDAFQWIDEYICK